jgi:hypothetical protein
MHIQYKRWRSQESRLPPRRRVGAMDYARHVDPYAQVQAEKGWPITRIRENYERLLRAFERAGVDMYGYSIARKTVVAVKRAYCTILLRRRGERRSRPVEEARGGGTRVQLVGARVISKRRREPEGRGGRGSQGQGSQRGRDEREARAVPEKGSANGTARRTVSRRSALQQRRNPTETPGVSSQPTQSRPRTARGGGGGGTGDESARRTPRRTRKPSDREGIG